MQDLVQKAIAFATSAHRRIDHRRKYTDEPYEVHLKDVADIVGSVSDDPETIAAAWLHDTVEDTPATFEDLEQEFGLGVAQLVAELTDVSTASDGNRATRKAIDLEHLAQASPRAKTVKLADLIDNCRDIYNGDRRFAMVFLREAEMLLDVLDEGSPELWRRADRLVRRYSEELDIGTGADADRFLPETDSTSFISPLGHQKALRTFTEAFSARDIAEPLRSFDAGQPADQVRKRMEELQVRVAGVREDGLVTGYVRSSVLSSGCCAEHRRAFFRDQVLDGDAAISDVIDTLTRHRYCFVKPFGDVSGVITRGDVQKPVVRIWLFGIVTVMEMEITDRIRRYWADGSWQQELSPERLNKARRLQQERQRRRQDCDLLDCLQLSDKAQIVMEDARQREEFGFQSKRRVKRIIREVESLRNNLAHAQDIVSQDWGQIARLSRRVEQLIATMQ